MASNTLTGLIPTIYTALDVVSREIVGFIQSVTFDPTTSRAAKDQTVTFPVAPASTATDITPAVSSPDSGTQTIAPNTLSISKSRMVPVQWEGEEQRSVGGSGPGYMRILQDQFAQAIRTLVNEVEADLGGLYIYASRASAVTDTTLFNSTLKDAAQARRVLTDNGAPLSELKMVIGSADGAALRGLSNFSKANEAGGTEARATGLLLDVHDFQIRESKGVQSHTKGTNSGGTVGTAAYSVGDVTLTLASAGTGTIVAGDVITLAGDTNKYVVLTGDDDVSNGGTIVLAAPGLVQAIAGAASPAITTQATGFRPLAFARSAIVLATRIPEAPEEGDVSRGFIIITDPNSGLSLEVREYPQYRRVHYEVGVAWGVKAAKTEHIVQMLGNA